MKFIYVLKLSLGYEVVCSQANGSASGSADEGGGGSDFIGDLCCPSVLKGLPWLLSLTPFAV